MQPTVSLPRVPRTAHHHAASPAQSAARRVAMPRLARNVTLGGVWRDAISTFAANSVPILMCAAIGLWGTGLVMAGPDQGVLLHDQNVCRWYTMILPVFSGFGHEAYRVAGLFCLPEQIALTVFALLQIFLALLSSGLARGMITWLALYRAETTTGDPSPSGAAVLKRACAAVLVCWPSLLAGSLLYAGVITASRAGLSDWLANLSARASGTSSRVQTISVGLPRLVFNVPRSHTPSPGYPQVDATNQLALNSLYASVLSQGIGTLIPDSDIPFASTLRRIRPPSPTQNYCRLEIYIGYGTTLCTDGRSTPTPADTSSIAPYASLAAILVAEAALRFRAVLALASGRGRFGLLSVLADGTRLGIRHFWTIMLHVWLFRLIIAVLTAVCVSLPAAILPALLAGAPGTLLPQPFQAFIAYAGSLALSVLFAAMSMVYDARLYVALTGMPQQYTVPQA